MSILNIIGWCMLSAFVLGLLGVTRSVTETWKEWFLMWIEIIFGCAFLITALLLVSRGG